MKNLIKKVSNTDRAVQVTVVGIIWNIILIIIKLFAGIYGRSSALVADAIHSMSDFVSDLAVLAGIRIARRPCDQTHNYGHGRFETLSTIVIAFSLFAAAAGIMWQGAVSIYGIWNGEEFTAPAPLALIVAAAAILIKEGLFHYTIHAGRKLNSQPLITNAWHHRTDAFSSITVLIGTAGAYFLGGRWILLDPLAALFVGVYILKFALKTLIENLNELLEASLGEEENQKIIDTANEVPGAINPHNLKSRRLGNTIALEMHIYVDPGLSVVEAHDIATEVEDKLKAAYGKSSYISVHVEPLESKGQAG